MPGGGLDLRPRQCRVQHEIASELALEDSGIGVEPHRRGLDDGLSEDGFAVGFHQIAQEAQGREEATRLLPLTRQRVCRSEIGLDDRTGELRPRVGLAAVKGAGLVLTNCHQRRRLANPGRPTQRKHLIVHTCVIDGLGPPPGGCC